MTSQIKLTPTTCQICGRPIKSASGLIAHHGYKRPGDGWQTSSCYGARHLPYEVSRDLIPEVIANISEWKANTQKRLADFITSPPSELIFTNRHEQVKVVKPETFTVDGYRSYRPMAYDTIYHSRKYEMELAIKSAEQQIEFLQERYDDWKKPELISEGITK